MTLHIKNAERRTKKVFCPRTHSLFLVQWGNTDVDGQTVIQKDHLAFSFVDYFEHSSSFHLHKYQFSRSIAVNEVNLMHKANKNTIQFN